MGFFSKVEDKMEDTLEGAADLVANAPISPVQIAKKAEKKMRRGKMVGAGKQFAPTLYTVLVNPNDDARLFGYYPTLAGETETYLAAKAAESGLIMDGQPLVRFMVDDNLRHGKFEVIAEAVASPLIEQLRQEEMEHYGIGGNPQGGFAPQTGWSSAAQGGFAPQDQWVGGYAPDAAYANGAEYEPSAAYANGAGYAPNAGYASSAENVGRANDVNYADYPAGANDAGYANGNNYAGYDDAQYASSAPGAEYAGYAGYTPNQNEHKPPLPYVPEDEIDYSIDYGEYTFNSQDFEDYRKNGPAVNGPAVAPAGAAGASANPAVAADAAGAVAAGAAGAAFASNQPATGVAGAAAVAASASAAAASANAAVANTAAPNTVVFAAGAGNAAPQPSQSAVRACLVDTTNNRTYALATARLLIGREQSCDIVLPDINASRTHAELRFEPQGVWSITDLGSTNGTHVNGQEITSQTLRPGDRLTIGMTSLIFQLA